MLRQEEAVVIAAEGRRQVPRGRRQVPRVAAGRQLVEGSVGGAPTANGRVTTSHAEGEMTGFAGEKHMIDRHLGDMERKSRGATLYGNMENRPDSYNQEEADKWGAFFDQLNTEVDVPKYGVKNLVVDNIEAIPPCDMDCGKHGEVLAPPPTLLPLPPPPPFSPSFPLLPLISPLSLFFSLSPTHPF